jgi:hypothetical protein
MASESSMTFYCEHKYKAPPIEIVANELDTSVQMPPPAPVIRYTSDPPYKVEDFTLIPQ